jgi:hypothetical protein
VVLCIVLFPASRDLYGQAATASISGRVTDSTVAAIPTAPLTVKNTGTAATQTVNTDAQGRYFVPDLPIGTYDVTASKMGFKLRPGQAWY